MVKKTTPAAKTAPKAAPAPAPAPAVEVEGTDEVTVDVGTQIRFVGYGEDVPAEQQFLTAGEVYTISGFTEPEGDDPGGEAIVQIANPGFNPKKRESADNPKTIDVQVFAEEYEVLEGEGEGEVAAEPAPAPVAAKTAAKAAAKTAPAAPAKTAAKPAAKTAAAPAAKKTAKAAPAPAAAEETPAEDPDELPDLEGEDEEVLALVNGGRDLIEVAQELEATASRSEYQLGGLLYHIKKGKTYLEIEGGEAYAEKGGWAVFVKDYFNVEYRKAQYLIQIYVAFTMMQIPNPADAVAEIGWAKAQKIAVPMMEEGAQPDDLLELARQNTVVDLSTALKEQVEVGGTPGIKVTRITMKFRYLEEEAASINAILETVKEANSLKDIGEALSFIVNDWASNNGMASAKSAPTQARAVGKAPAKKTAAAPAPAPKAAPAPARKVAAKV